MGVRHVRDAAYWGMPVGTPIAPGMRPARLKMSAGAKKPEHTAAAAASSVAPGKARQVFASAQHAELHQKTVPQLRQEAKSAGIGGHSRSKKADLVNALVQHRATSAPKPAAPAPPKPSAPAARAAVKTWEELGKPQGPSPVGQMIGHLGGTYERLPGEQRHYRVVNAEGRVLTDSARTADDARTALRIDDHDRGRVTADTNSAWRKALGHVSGSWSYDTGDVEGFDSATPKERAAIRDALLRWTEDKASTADVTRMAEPRVNAAVRGATARTSAVDGDIAALDKAFKISKTTRAITVHRGFSNGAHNLPDNWKTRDLKGLYWST
jgi:hypothetical protein